MSCIFCRIVSREIPANILFEDDYTCAFRDANPVAPVHVLVIPKKHVERIDSPDAAEFGLHIFNAIKQVALNEGLSEDGFRVVSNAGKNGGQTVDHLHFHLIGGRPFRWPPG